MRSWKSERKMKQHRNLKNLLFSISIYLCIYLSIYLSIYLTLCLCIYLSINYEYCDEYKNRKVSLLIPKIILASLCAPLGGSISFNQPPPLPSHFDRWKRGGQTMGPLGVVKCFLRNVFLRKVWDMFISRLMEGYIYR